VIPSRRGLITGAAALAAYAALPKGARAQDDEMAMLGVDQGAVASGGSSFSTWDPNNAGANITLSADKLTATAGATGWQSVRNTLSHSSGKWYFEFSCAATTPFAEWMIIGIGNASASMNNWVGVDANGWSWFNNNGHVQNNNTTVLSGDTWPAASGTAHSVAVDLTNNALWFYEPSQARWNASGTANPATNTGGISISAGTYFATYSGSTGGGAGSTAITLNVGATSFARTPPSGFSAWG
jgi:hypothetical protein